MARSASATTSFRRPSTLSLTSPWHESRSLTICWALLQSHRRVARSARSAARAPRAPRTAVHGTAICYIVPPRARALIEPCYTYIRRARGRSRGVSPRRRSIVHLLYLKVVSRTGTGVRQPRTWTRIRRRTPVHLDARRCADADNCCVLRAQRGWQRLGFSRRVT